MGPLIAGPGEPDDLEAQYAALYDANFNAVLGYVLRRVDQPADAADVVSEVFLVAWRRFDDAPPGDGRPWLFGIARHVLANHYRGARRRGRLGGKLRDVLARDVEPDPAAGIAEWDRVRRALLRLGPADRELLMLVAWDDLTPSEAAEVIGIAPGAARMRLSRARQRLRELLGPVEEVQTPGDAARWGGHVRGVPFESATGERR